MKKQFWMLMIIGAAACCFGACDFFDAGGKSDQYEKLNTMLDASYSQIVITVTDTFDEDTALTSEYRMSYSSNSVTVEYSVEQFLEVSLESPASNAKTRLVGQALIQNGNISFDGDEVPLTAEIAKPSLIFKKSYFKNAKLTDTSLVADVTSPSKFMGVTCTDMKLNAAFGEVFSTIEISYTSSIGSQVSYTYMFAS